MKKAIVTRADDNIRSYTNLTFPIMRRYADKCNADFIIISDPKGIHPHFRILQCYEMFDKYERILSMDCDIVIKNSCPNLFKVVPDNKIGSLLEDKGSRQAHRRALIKKVQEQRGDVGWTEGYINTGVFLFSKMHKEILNVDKDNLWLDFGQDDVELGYQIHKLGFEIFELDPVYNFMSMFDEGWYPKTKDDAYILHYAGGGFGDRSIIKEQQMMQDILKYNTTYKQKVERPKLTDIKKIENVGGHSEMYEARYNGEEVILKVPPNDEVLERERKRLEKNIDGVMGFKGIGKVKKRNCLILEKCYNGPIDSKKLVEQSLQTIRKLYLNDIPWIPRLDHYMLNENNELRLIDLNDEGWEEKPPFFGGIVTDGNCLENGVYENWKATPFSGWIANMKFICGEENLPKFYNKAVYKLVEKEYQSLKNVHQPIFYHEFKDILRTETETDDPNYGKLVKPNRECTDRFDMMKGEVDGETLLDIGSNVGYFCFAFAEEGLKCTGMEIDKEQVEFSKMVGELFKSDCEFIHGDINEFELKEYDNILALSMCHLYMLNSDEGPSKFLELFKKLSDVTKYNLFLEIPPYTFTRFGISNEEDLLNLGNNFGFEKGIILGVSDNKRPVVRYSK